MSTVLPLASEVVAALNPGIRRTVVMLRAAGFMTMDSGDGKTHEFECDLDVPYVHIKVEPAQLVDEAHRLLALVLAEFAPGAAVEASYSPQDGFALLHLFGASDEGLKR